MTSTTQTSPPSTGLHRTFLALCPSALSAVVGAGRVGRARTGRPDVALPHCAATAVPVCHLSCGPRLVMRAELRWSWGRVRLRTHKHMRRDRCLDRRNAHRGTLIGKRAARICRYGDESPSRASAEPGPAPHARPRLVDGLLAEEGATQRSLLRSDGFEMPTTSVTTTVLIAACAVVYADLPSPLRCCKRRRPSPPWYPLLFFTSPLSRIRTFRRAPR